MQSKNTYLSIKKHKLVFLLIFLSPLIVDAIYATTNIRVGIVYRGLIYIAATIFAISSISKKENKTLIYLAFYPILVALCSSLFYGEITLNLTEAAKYSYLFVLIAALTSNSNNIDPQKLLTHITNAGFAAALLILIPFALGIGSPTYFEGAYGNKGFFSAQNDIGLTLSLCLTISIFQFYERKSTATLTKSILIFFSMITLGTRFSILSALFIPICFIFGLRIKPIIILSIIALTFASAIYAILSDVFLFSDYERSKFENISFGDKGRFVLMAGAINFFESRSILENIFGSGTYEYLSKTYKNLSFLQLQGNLKAVEMDPFDIAGQYGIIFSLAVYFYLASIIYRARNSLAKKNSILEKSIGLALILAIAHSIFAGHTINNPIAAPILASIIAIPLLTFKSRHKELEKQY